MLSKESLKAIFILPFNVIISIPVLLIYFIEDFSFCKYVTLCLLAIPLFFMGIRLMIKTISLFDSRGKGSLAPWSPTKNLVVDGPYRFVRNPMISGVIFILLAESFVFSAESIFIEAIIFFTINTFYFKLKEEPDLEKRFGKEYVEYKNKVPMWIPRFKPYRNENNG